MTKRLDRDQRIYFRNMLREARAAALGDSEGYQQILFSLERLGAFITGIPNGDLGKYKDRIECEAGHSLLAMKIPLQGEHRGLHTPFNILYDLVKDARNDAFHQGAVARHLTEKAVKLSLVLEDALMDDFELVREYMVENVIVASMWHPISFIRQSMLENSFTFLPVYRGKEGWALISDHNVAVYLWADDPSKSERKCRLSAALRTTIGDKRKPKIELIRTTPIRPETCVSELIKNPCFSKHNLPILIANKGADAKENDLMGIITPYDLL